MLQGETKNIFSYSTVFFKYNYFFPIRFTTEQFSVKFYVYCTSEFVSKQLQTCKLKRVQINCFLLHE